MFFVYLSVQPGSSEQELRRIHIEFPLYLQSIFFTPILGHTTKEGKQLSNCIMQSMYNYLVPHIVGSGQLSSDNAKATSA